MIIGADIRAAHYHDDKISGSFIDYLIPDGRFQKVAVVFDPLLEIEYREPGHLVRVLGFVIGLMNDGGRFRSQSEGSFYIERGSTCNRRKAILKTPDCLPELVSGSVPSEDPETSSG
jgi:hypothetical protein